VQILEFIENSSEELLEKLVENAEIPSSFGILGILVTALLH